MSRKRQSTRTLPPARNRSAAFDVITIIDNVDTSLRVAEAVHSACGSSQYNPEALLALLRPVMASHIEALRRIKSVAESLQGGAR